MRLLLFFFFLIPLQIVQGQNLIYNPGAEIVDDPDPSLRNLLGWTIVSGFWKAELQVTPKSGTYYFYAGNNSPNNSELYQDVDVSSYATSIDAGTSTFNFSAWMRVWGFTFPNWNDQARAYVEYRDASSAVLSTYDTGLKSTTVWTQYSDSRVAPAGTRTIRIRLTATKIVGSDADGYFDDLVLTQTTTLPVTLVSFTSTLKNNAVELQWQTSMEEDNNYFALEKSDDGVTWEIISIQKGSSHARQLSSYHYTDKQLVAGLQYYRLTQTDIDGATTTFPAITQEVVLNSTYSFSVYPNPSNGPLTIATSDSGEKRLRIFSAGGQALLYETTFDANEFVTDLSDFSAGQYIIEVLTPTSVERTIFIKY